ncbi:bacteriophage terminase small subunit [Staphylococcus xylosus]|uniref:bacteriophage terminase small subunit n=1 Tax=Staphylococcus xylosus TaxID=1288 RepID=UPI000D1ED545|nr:bacteriophage terminase small subunit [Staphylococcus xylosus]PTI25719.1 transposase [Staphylococcus xylosus]HDP5827250.1 helix-turn-helix domain-containing protein [Staphylococcus aureus]
MPKKRGPIRTRYSEWLSDEKLQQIKSWKGQGASNAELAEYIGISRQTLYTWMDKYPEIKQAVKEGQQRTVEYIENALMKKISGYKLQETKRYKTTDKDGNEVTRVEVIEKEVGPDTTAIIYALKVKDPERWNEKIRMEHSGKVDSDVNHYANLDEKTLLKLASYE